MADPYIRQLAREALAQSAVNPAGAFNRSVLGAQQLQRPADPYLRQQYPAVFGGLAGLVGMAPDEMGGSVLDPNTARVREAQAMTYPIGTALQMLPGAKPAAAGAMAAGKAGERFAERAVPMVMERGGFGSELLQGMSRGAESYALPPAARSEFGAGWMPLQDEIDVARAAIQRQVIDLPSGEVQLIPRVSFLGTSGPQGLDAEVRFRTTSGRNFTVPPGQNIYPDFPITGEERQIIREARQNITNQKNELSNLIDAQRSITNTNPVPIPQWAREMTELNKSTQAGPEWWTKALKDKTAINFDEFVDAANNTSLMMYPKASTSKNSQEIANHFGVKATQNLDSVLFSNDNGVLKIIGANTNSPYISASAAKSEGKKEGGGKALYQAAYNWAANNGKIIKPDPRGMSDINEIRKIGNALSGQIRNGKLIAEMNSGNFSGLKSISELWREESRIAKKRIPFISNLKFDGSSFNMNDADIVLGITKKDPSFEKGVGTMTAKRSAIADWLETATPLQSKKAVISLLAAGSGPLFAMEDNITREKVPVQQAMQEFEQGLTNFMATR